MKAVRMDNIEDILLRMICDALAISRDAILDISCRNIGLNNMNYVLSVVRNGQTEELFVRLSGPGNELFCNRKGEHEIYKKLAPYLITDKLVFLDEKSGLKISRYYPQSHTTNCKNEEEILVALDLLHQIQGLPIRVSAQESVPVRMRRYKQYAMNAGWQFDQQYWDWCAEAEQADRRCTSKEICLTHGDFNPDNILFPVNSRPIIIDWEFPTMGYHFDDLAAFCLHAKMNAEQADHCLDLFLQRAASEQESFNFHTACLLSSVMWYAWAAYKLAVGGDSVIYSDFVEMCNVFADSNLALLA